MKSFRSRENEVVGGNRPDKRWPLLRMLMIVVTLGLFVVPQTRFVILFQTRILIPPVSDMEQSLSLHGAGSGATLSHDNPMAQEAARHPEDYQDQLAMAFRMRPGLLDHQDSVIPSSRWDKDVLRSLEGMIPRFSQQPSLYAHLLRYSISSGVSIDRPEKDWGRGHSYIQPARVHPLSPAVFDAFDRWASVGERLDPDNAFFPYIRAGGLFGMHRDADAVSEISSAGLKERWDDYLSEEPAAQEHLMKAVWTPVPATIRILTRSDTWMQHHMLLTDTAWMTVYEAVVLEKAGHTDDGFLLRHALMLCGSRMMRRSQTATGNRLGAGILSIAMFRPGGIAADGWVPPDQARKAQQLRTTRFYAYLRQIGHPREAEWAEAEMQSAKQIRSILDDSFDHSVTDSTNILALGLLCTMGVFTLSNLLWLLALSGSTLVRVRRLPDMAPLLAVAVMWVSLAFWTWQARGVDGFARTAWLAIWIVGSCSPGSANFKTNLRRTASRFSCGLLIVYSILVAVTAVKEVRSTCELDQMLRHEGQYYASNTGRNWPGPSPLPAYHPPNRL